MAKDKWWIIEGAPKPVYVYSSKDSRRRHMVFVLISVIVLASIYLIDIFSSELAILMLSLLIFGQIIDGIVSFYKRTPGETEKAVVRNLVKLLGKRVVVWSIPTRYIVAAIRIRGGVFIYVFVDKGRAMILVIKPVMFMGIAVKKHVTIKVKKTKIKHEKAEERIEAIAPYPENPRMWYKIVGKGVLVDASRADLNDIVSIANNL
ncbi:hypothetical protein J4526_05405 [Desulfurococcaceae archaeon MEX13E-LK6-19]|nr:hypothetical protein J4526_05405 [Desulfurococcaceae archaeon MEX13E-LK6-19]